METITAHSRLLHAEQQGLRLAILCRTVAVGLAAVWYVSAWGFAGFSPNPIVLAALASFTAYGIGCYLVVGTRHDRREIKYALYAADILGLCALFVLVPVSREGDVPQVMVFRAYGIYYLFPLVAMATLSLSWRLVVWAGLIAVVGWWAAFTVLIAAMPEKLSWGDIQPGVEGADFLTIFLSPNFIGAGNRVEETGTLMIAAIIMAIAVRRARHVFYAHVAAEEDKAFIAQTFGEYVPEHIAERLIKDRTALEPQTRRASVMCVDVAGFTKLTAAAGPEQTITILNAFFTDATEVISDHGGVVVDFSGDGFIATFNAPIDLVDYEQAATNAARALLARVQDTTFAGQTLAVRIGLTTGDIAGGSVGGGRRRTYTVHGDTVNLAARLESMAKEHGVTLLMDAETAKALPPETVHQIGEPQAVRGRIDPVTVFGLE